MPAYFSIEYSFPYNDFSINFTQEIYETIFEDFPFKSGYWNSEGNSLEEIIAWNSKLLSDKFKLGFDQHVKHNYKQMLLQSDQFSHLRLFWMYQTDEIVLHLILPENEVELENHYWKFKREQIAPLLNLSLKIWEKHELNMVQTYKELGESTEIEHVLKGELTASEPFSIIKSGIFENHHNDLDNREKIVINKGMLIIEQEYMDLLDKSR
ncbi:hypothetical protein [Paenibacillus xylanexedens]|uniref:hypothetical protein n=1 Tax=Paenibacillus xylanexedens TaxID=528191 RepID=UPI0011A014A1|nr:hypothetical protein [Paenibacillus xylanexedens]